MGAGNRLDVLALSGFETRTRSVVVSTKPSRLMFHIYQHLVSRNSFINLRRSSHTCGCVIAYTYLTKSYLGSYSSSELLEC